MGGGAGLGQGQGPLETIRTLPYRVFQPATLGPWFKRAYVPCVGQGGGWFGPWPSGPWDTVGPASGLRGDVVLPVVRGRLWSSQSSLGDCGPASGLWDTGPASGPWDTGPASVPWDTVVQLVVRRTLWSSQWSVGTSTAEAKIIF